MYLEQSERFYSYVNSSKENDYRSNPVTPAKEKNTLANQES